MAPKKRIVKVLVVICITAILGVAVCGCDDLGSFSDVEEYYASFGDIVLLSGTTKERKEYSVKDYFYNKKHQTVDIIKLNGSVELGPLVGLGDVIVDIVETGSTLRENGLDVLEEICPLSARMIVNQVSMQMYADRIKPLIANLKKELEKEAV